VVSVIKKKIENWFADSTRFIFHHRWLIIIAMLALTVGTIGQLPKLRINTSNESFLHETDPTLAQYNKFKDQFGRDDLIVVAIKSPAVFSQAFLKKLKELHDDLEANLPHVDEITSLVNARNTRGEGDQLIVDDLLEHWPATEADLETLRKVVMDNPLYRNRLISDDGTFTTILIRTDTYAHQESDSDVLAGFDDTAPSVDEKETREREYLTDKENSAVVKAARELLANYDSPDFRIYMAGSPVVTDTVKKAMMHDMPLFMRLALLVIGICLFFIFHRLSGIFLPLLIVALSVLSTLGMMAITNTQFKVPTIILPSFLMAVGVGDCVHILAIFYHQLKKTGSKEESIVYALQHSGLAVVMTSLTTAAGLASFATADVAPIADLGLFSSVGVMIALLYTIILLPALLAVIPIKRKDKDARNLGFEGHHQTMLDRILDRTTDIATGYPKTIFTVSLMIIVIASLGASRLQFRHDILAWLPASLPVKQATQKIDQELKGTVAMEVVIDTGRENGLYDPENLQAINKVMQEVSSFRDGDLFVGKVMSVVDILKEINRALHENRPEAYVVPDQAALIPQEFLLFENSGSDDLEDVVDSRFQLARVTIKVPWFDAIRYVPFMHRIENSFSSEFAGKATITTTGIMSLFGRIIHAAIHSAAKSYVIAFAVITIMMILLIGNLQLGMVSMMPNLLPILVVMGIMGWFNLSLDMFTMLIASIAIGLAVDDTIHFMYNFRRYYGETHNAVESVRHTFHTTGRAMLVTSIVLSIGFFIFMLSTLSNVFLFGLLTGIAIILALAADFLLGPALMVLMTGSERIRKQLGIG